MTAEFLTPPTDVEWMRFAVMLLGIALVIGCSEFLRIVVRFPPERSRKAVHILIGGGILAAPWLFESAAPLLLMSGLFLIFNLVSVRRGWLKGMHPEGRCSYGTVYYPAAMIVLTLLFWPTSPHLVVCSMATFSFGDAAAALTGTGVRSPRVYRLTHDPKSVQGSAAMFVTTLMATLLLLIALPFERATDPVIIVGAALCVAVVATAAEALSSYGLDNVFVPVLNALVLSAFLFPNEPDGPRSFLIGLVLGGLVAYFAFRYRLLGPDGAIAAFVLAVIVFGFGGVRWASPIAVFFLLSSLLSFAGASRKRQLEGVFEKSSTRDAGQVAANGGIAGFVVGAQFLFPEISLYPAFVGSIAAVTADTWGTEVGVLSRGETVSVVGFRKVASGTSGGISLAGTAAGIAGALVIGLTGALWDGDARLAAIAVAAGATGSLVDSMAGATIQARFECNRCGRITDRETHCDESGHLVAGYRFVRNDAVNWLCGFAGAVAGFALG